MPRPREFDEHAAVERAMHLFWDNGYEATSTQQLCEATGLSRSSIYNAFASKHALFQKSLRQYMSQATRRNIELLRQQGPVRQRLHDLLARVVEDECTPGRRGCFVVNTAAELGGRDAEITEDLRRDTATFVEALREVVLEGQRAGEIDGDADPLALAQFVHSTISGLRVMSRNGSGRAALENVAAVALQAL
ncbi:TetR/AcrR family transcriptional regulator [Prauserella muralis]|uniref:Transcriptional regulator n=1 Tax=Prauserella muralis TaxID=588067 RepID=A0A2V4ANY0_9PSEU|nr:TetR/AcrR family transcriptional regulator [Prauserella muralis]PXY22410.1 transcriptional regulator [Prauserella muralis]TWE28074.1 TetR family transcriptional regulator [Prauserella muralis]